MKDWFSLSGSESQSGSAGDLSVAQAIKNAEDARVASKPEVGSSFRGTHADETSSPCAPSAGSVKHKRARLASGK
jgi:hypothetical protein